MENKPGVMIYFDMAPILDRLSDKNAGILFRAILEYGATGQEPELPDRLRLVWPMIQMRLMADDQRYQTIIYKRKYAAYSRWAKYHGQTPVSYDQWLCELAYEED